MRKITLLLVFFFAIGTLGVFAQTRTVTGKVTGSQDGLGIPGVTVMVKEPPLVLSPISTETMKSPSGLSTAHWCFHTFR